MGDRSLIEWTDATWNPVTGCTKVSEGCRNCYMFRTVPRQGQDPEVVVLHPDRLDQPLHWKQPRRIFVNSLSDLFHENVPDEFIEQVFAVMALTPQHTYQILTKRPTRMRDLMNRDAEHWADMINSHAGVLMHWDKMPDRFDWPMNNLWLGVSGEDQKTFEERWKVLRETPAARRFLSLEPLLGGIDLQSELWEHLTEWVWPDWIIVGGESGPGARPMHPAWVRGIRDQCQSAGIPFFFKQWGEWAPAFSTLGPVKFFWSDGVIKDEYEPRLDSRLCMHAIERIGKREAGRLLDGREWNEFPGLSAHRSALSVGESC